MDKQYEALSDVQKRYFADWKYTGNKLQKALKIGPRKPLYHDGVTLTPKEAKIVAETSSELELVPFEVSVDDARKTIGIEKWWIEFAENQGRRTGEKLLEKSPWAYRCVEIRSRALASIPWYLEPESKDLFRLLDEVNPETNWVDLIAATSADMDVFGKAFWLKVFSGNVKFLQRVNPSLVKIDADENGINGFKIDHIDEPIKRSGMVYFHTYDPNNDFEGIAPIETVRDAIEVENESNATLKEFFENRASPDLIMSLATSNPNELTRVRDKWYKDFRGKGKQHKTAFVGGNAEPHEVGYAPERLALTEVRAEARRQICAGLGVPPALVGAWEAANYATIREQRQSLYTETVLPRADYMKGVIDAELCKDFGSSKFFWKKSEIVAMQETEDDKAKRLVWFVEAKIIKPEVAAILAGFKKEDVPEPLPIPDFGQGNQNNNNNMGRETSPPPISDERKTETALRKWRKKALNSLRKGRGALCDFESDYIPDGLKAAIMNDLEEAESPEDVGEVFENYGGINAPRQEKPTSVVVNVENKMPEQKPPEVMNEIRNEIKMPDVKPPDVHVNVPEAKAAEVRVENIVTPTDPQIQITNEVTVDVPKVKRETKRIKRDPKGAIDQTDSTFEYD